MSGPRGTRPLAELDDVDWSQYRHAYGPADDVPQMIRALAATIDDEGGVGAEHELWSAVLHQGQVEPVTVEALPFVLGILSTCSTPGQVLLADWLTDLSQIFGRDEDTYLRCTMTIEAAVETVLDLLTSSEPSVRSAAAGVVGSLPRVAVRSWPALRERLGGEDQASVRSDVLVSLGRLASAADRTAETVELLGQAKRAPSSFERCAAFTGQLLIDPHDEEAQAYLLSLLPAGMQSGTWWGVGNPTVIIDQLTANPGWIDDVRLFEEVRSTALALRGFAAESVLRVLMDGLFPGGATDVPRFAADLDPRARETFELLESVPALFRRDPVVEPTQSVMHHLVLPSDSERIRRWLDGADRRDCVAPGVVRRFDEIFGGH